MHLILKRNLKTKVKQSDKNGLSIVIFVNTFEHVTYAFIFNESHSVENLLKEIARILHLIHNSLSNKQNMSWREGHCTKLN